MRRSIQCVYLLVLTSGAAWGQISVPKASIPVKIEPTVDANLTVFGNGEVKIGAFSCAPQSGENSKTCTRAIAKDAQTVFIATPRDGQQFSGWAGACAGQGSRCFLTPKTGITLAANFTVPAAQPMVKIKVDIPVGGGSVMPDTFAGGGINCTHKASGYYGGTCEMSVPVGTQVGLKANPEPGITFAGWKSDQSGCSGSDCTFNAKDPVTLTATFNNPKAFNTLTVIVRASAIVGVYFNPTPSVTFKCAISEAPAGGPGLQLRVCTASLAAGSSVVLSPGMAVGGVGATTFDPKNYGGDCPKTTLLCKLDMAKPRTVTMF